jgi:GNAT superfamily N-acetyltransferase
MGQESEFRPSHRSGRYELALLTDPAPGFARYLYATVGGPYHWVDRSGWSDAQWLDRLNARGVELWVAWGGGAPVGYFELEGRPGGPVDIVYFGLMPHALGQGQGGPLLSDAVARAWLMGAERVRVNTCSLDHPAALANYQARGFRVVGERIRD